MVFLHKKFPKSSFPQIVPIIQGTLLTFLPKKVIIFSKCAFISSIILTFLPNNPVCFYTKKYQKLNFPLNCAHNTVHFIDFSPKKSEFFFNMRLHIEHYLDFFAQWSIVFTKKSQKVNFSSNCAHNTGHFIDFSPKKNDFFLKMPLHIEHYFDFFAQ